MNWIKFTIWLSLIYAAYYGLLISWDCLHSRRTQSGEEENELTFVEHEEPVWLNTAAGDAGPADRGSPVVSSGGVTIKQMLSLAQDEAIVFTRAVSFS